MAAVLAEAFEWNSRLVLRKQIHSRLFWFLNDANDCNIKQRLDRMRKERMKLLLEGFVEFTIITSL